MFDKYEDDLFWEICAHVDKRYGAQCFTIYYINCDQNGSALYIKIPELCFTISIAWDEIMRFYEEGGIEYACKILDNTINEAKRRLGLDW